MQTAPQGQGSMGCGEAESSSSSSSSRRAADAPHSCPRAAAASKWGIFKRRFSLGGSLLLLLLLAAATPSVCDFYQFDETEIPVAADMSLPLPRPFDSTACALQHLAQQQQLLLALQQLQPAASRSLLQDPALAALHEATRSGLVAEEVSRHIEFGRQAKITVELQLHNKGAAAAASVFILLPFSEATQLGWMKASAANGKQLKMHSVSPFLPSISSLSWEDWGQRQLLLQKEELLLAAAAAGRSSNFKSPCWPSVFQVQLERPLQQTESVKLTVSYILGRPYRPLPRAVELEAIQSVIFATSLNWPSPYKTLKSSLSFQLPPQTSLGEAGERRMQQKSFQKLSEGLWKWASAAAVDPLAAVGPFAMVFPLPQHLGFLFAAERLLLLPLSGAAVSEDFYKFHNDAALQQGPFNPISVALLQGLAPGTPRLALQNKEVPRAPPVPSHVLFDLHATLPPDVFNLDVADSAGNLTTAFAAREGPEGAPLSTRLEVWPRFPVLGGWNFDLRVIYSQPVSSLLLQQEAGSSSSSVSLKIPLEPIFSETYAEQLSLTVALPTGATNIRCSSPVEFDSVEEKRIKWWFDIVTSRPALTLKWHSFSASPSPHEERSLTVTFDYPYPVDLEHFKKLLLLLLLLAVLVIATLLSRWKLRFTTPEEEAAAAALQSAFEKVRKELGRVAEAAIKDTGSYLNCAAAAAAESGQSSSKQMPQEQEMQQWSKCMQQHENDVAALLQTAPEANSSIVAFQEALEDYRNTVQAFAAGQLKNVKDKKTEKAEQDVKAAADQLRAAACCMKLCSTKLHKA
ncbi:ribophorin I, putative [Eimeria tenella]|uniref:Dolichyl-diphosphooligosaccharide--protein glycosyltransferase subunit 1 n=1 Tax=Eimeria tenella TaxID=5802 RepID=U6KQ57_EIMTE|nr:ribophorin I, putative [Eimeria tenella]CDJ40262.1 ribophorin I, putative [Eimeria tenella]|eukprot:XP_013231015.1 ribophorin I, putative [Eimeria tenella]